MPVKENHIANLDLFRAMAIFFVILFHLTQMFAPANVDARFYLWGKYGVDLFFVLSGFLIGGLYYKQKEKVNLFNFWFLRVTRTYPPYIIALLVSYLTVFLVRHEKFDFGYLIFVQNFYHKIPYFLVSWSLCIEEHFYIVFPFLLIIADRILKKTSYQLFFWIVLSLLPTVIRFVFGTNIQNEFGYYETATIFRFDGIAMGCLLSFIVYRVKIKPVFSPLSKILAFFFFIASLAFNVFFIKYFFGYCFGYLLLNISIFYLITIFYFSPAFPLSKSPLIARVAAMAYSLYLTHAVVINFMSMALARYKLNYYLVWVATFFIILATGYLFYWLIEKQTIRLRNRYFGNSASGNSVFREFFIRKKERALAKSITDQGQ